MRKSSRIQRSNPALRDPNLASNIVDLGILGNAVSHLSSSRKLPLVYSEIAHMSFQIPSHSRSGCLSRYSHLSAIAVPISKPDSSVRARKAFWAPLKLPDR